MPDSPLPGGTCRWSIIGSEEDLLPSDRLMMDVQIERRGGFLRERQRTALLCRSPSTPIILFLILPHVCAFLIMSLSLFIRKCPLRRRPPKGRRLGENSESEQEMRRASLLRSEKRFPWRFGEAPSRWMLLPPTQRLLALPEQRRHGLVHGNAGRSSNPLPSQKIRSKVVRCSAA